MKPRRYLMDDLHPFMQLILLGSLALISSTAFTFLGFWLVRPFFGITNIDVVMKAALDNPDMVAANMRQVNALKLIQFLASLGTFLFPALVFARIKFPGGDFLHLNRRVSFLFVAAGILILATALPFINVTYELNKELKLPSSLAGLEEVIRESEKAMEQFTKAFLHTPRPPDLWINLLVLAVVPALGEEVMFRGCVQQLFKEWTKNVHAGIWIAAVAFSLLHFDLYGFLPRTLLGGLLGYLFVWSGSLWVPIIGHAFHNGAQVVLAHLYEHKMIEYDILSEESLPIAVTLVSSLVCLILMFFLYRNVIEKKFIY